MKTMRSLLMILLVAVASLCGVTSCISDDFTTSPSDLLTFSRDTVTFDTVFTGLGTPTARLIVHNRAKKAVNISSIRFAASDGTFSMNVDGVSGKEFSDVEIRGEDSIYVFIECYIPESQTAEPYLVSDRLQFVTNGVTQNVEVEAYGQNVTRLRGVTLDADMTLTDDRPYVVFDSLKVASGATLNILPGARLLFHDKAHLIVEGRLEAAGAPGKMIQMRGDRLDDVLPDVEYDIMSGQWEGVSIRPGSFGNRMEYVDMRSTRRGLVVDSCGNLSERKLLLVNSWLHNSQHNVLESAHAWVDAFGCCFSEAADAVVSLKGGKHEFVQFTIANNYLFSAIWQPLLCLYHLLPGDEEGNASSPLMSATFSNGIIYGLAADINTTDLTGSDVFLRNVLLKSEGNDDANFLSCIWGADPLFYTERDKYYFNYHVRPDSPAIGAGDSSWLTPLCETDMDGLPRQSPPTVGAYVYTAPEE